MTPATKKLKLEVASLKADNARLRALLGEALRLRSMPASGIPEDGDDDWPVTLLRKVKP
jgi:hypothetical protein